MSQNENKQKLDKRYRNKIDGLNEFVITGLYRKVSDLYVFKIFRSSFKPLIRTCIRGWLIVNTSMKLIMCVKIFPVGEKRKQQTI